MQYTDLVFDFDGTLIDTKPLFRRVIVQYAKEYNLNIKDPDLLVQGYGYAGDHELIEGLDKDAQKAHLHHMFDRFDILVMEDPSFLPPLFAGVPETLNALAQRGYRLSVCTSKPLKPFLYLLKAHDIEKFFNYYRTFDDVDMRQLRPKPYPDKLLHLLEEMGASPENAVVIGDTQMDMKMAVAANAKALGVSWGYHTSAMLISAGAESLLQKDLSEILSFLE